MPNPIPVIVDHKIRVPIAALVGVDETLPRQIVEALTIPNLAKAEAKKQHQWGWERMPDTIQMWDIDDEENLIMPRGFGRDFKDGILAMGQHIRWRDWRSYPRIDVRAAHIKIFPWQADPIKQIRLRHQGIWKAPAGSGKTVGILEAIRSADTRSLVIINTKDVLWQWQDRVTRFLGPEFPIGQIGDNQFDIAHNGITIATAQTIHSRFDELDATGFFDYFGFVCLDECHHATADTYNRVLNRFSARYRVGVSATPDKTGDFTLAKLVLGPVIHETKPDEVKNLIKPSLIKVPTKFGFGFRGTKNRWQRSNYGEMIQALITNPERNWLITSAIMREQGHHCLVVSKRLEHLDILEDHLLISGYEYPILKLTGKEKREERQRVVEIANTEPCVILSTLADEALDIPILDRLFLVFPQKNPGLVIQQVGRVERKHPGKENAIIYDFCDNNVGPLEKQWRVRRFEVYEPRGYQITTLKAEELLQERIT